MVKDTFLSLPEALDRLRVEPELFVVYDKNVTWVAREICAGLPVRDSIGISASETDKTLETVLELERRLMAANATRGALLVAVGGGITTDLVGFAASIYKRGIRYANVPTTLLAQVDAAIGGKTGVNMDGYKNMLGAFRMPEFTVLEAAFLDTLPQRELRSGLAEMLKTFLLADGEAYRTAVDLLRCAGEASGLQDLVRRAALIKAGIVDRDPLEKGERAVLNLGHTFGHAIEHEARVHGDDITHGEAVSMGMVLAALLSEGAGVAEKGLAARLRDDFTAIGLPTESPYPVEALLEAVRKDKKATGARVKFVLPVTPGEVILKEMTPEEAYDCYLPAK